jgi:hypothetical protein
MRPIVTPTSGMESSPATARSVIQFNNSAENGLGFPMPAGTVNIFRKYKNGFGVKKIANVSIPHQNVNNILTLQLGELGGISMYLSKLSNLLYIT